MFQYFYNKNLSPEVNSILFWTWESIVHHIYFIVLFVQRQFSEKWETKELWRVNMEKECEFFAMLFGGDPYFCAASSTGIFSGLWFRTSQPNMEQMNWIGRLIANYQHCEAIIHFLICILGLIIVVKLGNVSRKTGEIACGVSDWIRWGFFVSLHIEVYTMCFPYFFLFGWGWLPFVARPKDPLVSYIESFSEEDSFLSGVQFGAAWITMFWVATLVTVLDTWAMLKAWNFARNGQESSMLAALVFGVPAGVSLNVWFRDFFSEGGRGAASGEGYASEIIADWLHHLFGGDYTPMATLWN